MAADVSRYGPRPGHAGTVRRGMESRVHVTGVIHPPASALAPAHVPREIHLHQRSKFRTESLRSKMVSTSLDSRTAEQNEGLRLRQFRACGTVCVLHFARLCATDCTVEIVVVMQILAVFAAWCGSRMPADGKV